MSQEQPEYMLCSNSAPFTDNSVVEYSPDDFVTTCIEPPSPSYPLPIPQSSQHLQLTTPTLQWSTSSDGSTSPSTPSTALMTPVTQCNSMSRQSSYNPTFFDTVSMMRVASDSSCMLPILPEDGVFSFPYPVESKTISSSVDTSHFLFSTGSANGHFLAPSASSSYSVAASAQALASPPSSSPSFVTQQQPDLAEDMRRSASASSSDASSAPSSSSSSTCSRQTRREREINAQAASRKLAPKAFDDASEDRPETESLSSHNVVTMTKIQSSDGTSKTVGVLPKTHYVRPQHPKIMCVYCAERPEGFRGTHELDRHIARAHASRRKGYICVDYSSDGKFLANCKHCRGKKVYGAYYNAAAHLRRAHFHPRKRGRKGKNDEKRGGIGGGDHPAMDYLKQHWIKEIEVANTKRVPLSPESGSDGDVDADAEAERGETYEAIEQEDEAMYAPPQAASASSQIAAGAGGYMDYGVSMSNPMNMSMGMALQAGEPMMLFDGGASGYAGFEDASMPGSSGDLSGFQFDAYMAQ